MHITFSAFSLTLIIISNLSLAFALATPNPANNSNTTITPPSRYYLKTRVLDNNGNADKNNLYVSSYHTGVFALKPPFPSLFLSLPLLFLPITYTLTAKSTTPQLTEC